MDELTTGSKSLDELLGGGVGRGVLTQVYGAFATGKTTFAMQVGLLNNGKVAYIDTEGGFSPERLKIMAEKRGLNADEVLQRFIIFEPHDFKEQKRVISKLKTVVNERFSLIVVDSITSHYRVEKNKQSLNVELGKQLQVLLWLARKYNLAVIVVNQVYFDSNSNSLKPIAEHTLGYKCKDILRLERLSRPGLRIAVLERHRFRPEGGIVYFKITDKGIEDI
ncbi:DNA repair and recombination protein RadB [Thermococcus sp. M39]|uniref:DNA repair and recombination protein RadB n=1 Tax=unclassified Thermococcus TaxID=2627626 RepID=UPI0014395B5C|nr:MULTISPECIES: DNA repair and recombination protein RadB [unclassified Thermococcus]NJE07821.1 DNA repair and recombination protein RadB [Thermococcus sp. M39]NJE12375.1 DNA repair and recombination protein RadB [Thermococcus sp. LS2]